MLGSWPRSTSSLWASSSQPAGTRRTDGSGCISCIRSFADVGSGSSSSARRWRDSRPAVSDWTGMRASRRTTDARASWTSTPTRGGEARLVSGVPERRTQRSWTRASSRSNRSWCWTLEPSVLRGPSCFERGWPNPRLGTSPSFGTGMSRDWSRLGLRDRGGRSDRSTPPTRLEPQRCWRRRAAPRSRRRVLARHAEPERRCYRPDEGTERHRCADVRTDGSRPRSGRRHLDRVSAYWRTKSAEQHLREPALRGRVVRAGYRCSASLRRSMPSSIRSRNSNSNWSSQPGPPPTRRRG